jgi:anti-sigma factor RsiW
MNSHTHYNTRKLIQLVLGQLDESELRPMLEHLASCRECREQARALRAAIVSRFKPPENSEDESASIDEDEDEDEFDGDEETKNLELSRYRG